MPLLTSLKELHNFDVETQVQHFAPLAIQKTVNEQGTIFEEDQLKAFINGAEWNLGARLKFANELPVN